ncbi:MAG: methylenetetrahydrofolate reductase [NAD(P)H] [Provencibacterium sp.]|jgi:methylenetetrahydrofolate reductase (NADPH)|nr:methylenetetrahydrofolate reductase [NAD(P)H] [Provencibacterium sp.]
MKLSKLFQEKRVVLSFEVFPPKKNGSIDTIYETLEGLCPLRPDFISVTYGAGGNMADRSTIEIASLIKNRYHIEPLAHLTCVNSARQQVSETLQELKKEGIENILALRGDLNPDMPPRTDFRYASELIKTVREAGDFHISAACYPEGHSECATLEEDIEHLKEKVDAGASHLITQLFFDNTDFYHFRELARRKGISVPIEAGIMPVINKRQIERMVSMCGASMPKALARLLSRYGSDAAALREAGIAYATQQIIDLIGNSVQGIHLYTMNTPVVAQKIVSSVGDILRCENERHE